MSSEILTKNQARILQEFTAHITEEFSMRETARILKKDSSLVRKAMLPLIEQGILNQAKKTKRITLNYRENHPELAYAEHLRAARFAESPKNSGIAAFMDEIKKTIQENAFTLSLSGSAIMDEKSGGYDVLLIVAAEDGVRSGEKALRDISKKHQGLKIGIDVVCFQSALEMLSQREQLNVMNRSLDKHIIFHGAETYYGLITKGRR